MSARDVLSAVASGVNPISAAASHDVFKVKGPFGEIYSPPCKIVECNGRELNAQEMQAPGFTGAILVIRGTKLVSVTYRIDVYQLTGQASFDAADRLIRVLQAAQNARPVQGVTLTDLRLKYLRIPAMAPMVIPHQNQPGGPGLWDYTIKFTENARLKIAGGPVMPPRNPDEVAIQAQELANNAKRQTLADLQANAAKNAGQL